MMANEMCPCGARLLRACPGRWEQGCDLCANAAHVGLAPGQSAMAEIQRLSRTLQTVLHERNAAVDELIKWRKLRDPETLHANLLRGLPAQLSRATFLHLAGDHEAAQYHAAMAGYRPHEHAQRGADVAQIEAALAAVLAATPT